MSIGLVTSGTIASALGVNLGKGNEYPIISNGYYVVLGTILTSFSRISGITLKSSELKPVNEGGSNKPYIFRDTKKEFNTITFEKGYGTLDVMELIDELNTMTIIIKGNDKSVQGVYCTDRAVVQTVTLSDLEASESKVLIQSMTIAYNTLKKSDKAMNDLKKFSSTNNSIHETDSITGKQISNKMMKETKNIQETEKKEKSKDKLNIFNKIKNTIDEVSNFSERLKQQEEQPTQAEKIRKTNTLEFADLQNFQTKLAAIQNRKAELKQNLQRKKEQKKQEEQLKEIEKKIEFD